MLQVVALFQVALGGTRRRHGPRRSLKAVRPLQLGRRIRREFVIVIMLDLLLKFPVEASVESSLRNFRSSHEPLTSFLKS